MIAMSGGVDSSVAAALLVSQGHEVIGATMEIFPDYEQRSEEEGGCCSLAAIEDAKRVASRLDIPHYTLNFKKVFQREVIDNFAKEYSRGRTPNPCIVCNKKIKFAALLQRARELDCQYVATGHYSRIKFDPETDRYHLYRSIDRDKDQSYMLYGFTQHQLQHTLLPLGDYEKTAVREKARDLGFRVHNKPDSQEICFVPDNDYQAFLERNYPEIGQPGNIYYYTGEKIGRHQGLHHYTIGQRRGLGISLDHPVYVVEINNSHNALIVAPREKLKFHGLKAQQVNWIAYSTPPAEIEASVQVRYNSCPVPAKIFTYQPEDADSNKSCKNKKNKNNKNNKNNKPGSNSHKTNPHNSKSGSNGSFSESYTDKKTGDSSLNNQPASQHSKSKNQITLTQDSSRVQVEFNEPCTAVTPGQSVVFYQGDLVLGGGIISEGLKGQNYAEKIFAKS